MDLELRILCLYLQGTGITGVRHHCAQFYGVGLVRARQELYQLSPPPALVYAF